MPEFFFEKNDFLSLFSWSGLKTVFHCSAHRRILSRPSFSIFIVSSGSETIEKKEVSLANNLTFDFRSVAKSFMYIRKKRGHQIDPCGTPARIHSQSEVFPLRVTLWTLSLRKLLINPSRFPLTPFCFNLNNKPSCHTLSKAFDISKNTPRVSKEELESKLRKMSCVIASNW